MLKSEVQHQFWITKKTVQRKLGSKEDEHIVSSDAGLDSKIALLKSISETCLQLNKILEQFQERLCTLSQEECAFGRFLKEIGKRSKTTGSSIINSGKAIYFCGQQRMSVRVPLLRLHHEVDIFRCRAISDTVTTMKYMEKERTEYRAALSWMKSLSMQLDPDNGKGLDKFRRAQSAVRIGKDNFDKLSMDCIQKIDLLAAARCNMFSHCLVAYMTAILQFSKKSKSTFEAVAQALVSNPRYDFCVLKELSQNIESIQIQTDDTDQSMFFSSDFKDTLTDSPAGKTIEHTTENMLLEDFNNTSSFENNWFGDIEIDKYITDIHNPHSPSIKTESYTKCQRDTNLSKNETKASFQKSDEKDSVSNWFNLFSELDPFENPQSFDLKLYTKSNSQQT
ncbi:islet cell autoantigen 1 [Eupeodes corollae]|uniref:islet cell autoantigen 1 n=1 Tax=Eupeodes corollae TaxID=290404 RepID=UPI002492501D|nr:islet cell autoantigen 1 [Eupeodes corollae]